MDNVSIHIGSRRELFVDDYLIDTLDGTTLKLHEPRSAGVALTYEEPWEDWVCSYTTVLRDGDLYRMYYRGRHDGSWTGYAESSDGIHWTKPRLGLVEFDGSTANNIILNGAVTFFPFLDTRPGVPAAERFKANAVVRSKPEAGLIGYASADGLRWCQLQDEPILSTTVENAFDSQNVMFWSEEEQSYVLYARHWEGGRRATMRATSSDFRAWTRPTFMTYSDTGTTTPSAHLYTNQTQPYFRAPHIYISLPGRIFFADAEHLVLPDDIVAAGQRSVSPELRQFYEESLDPRLRDCQGDTSDGVLLSTRAGSTLYDFTFLQSFVRPGIGMENWTTRNNYPTCGFVQTSPTELSFYVKRHCGQRTLYLERMTLRLDGFASLHAPYTSGQMRTRPLTFDGRELEINYATSAAGSVRVELQHLNGTPLVGRSLADCVAMTGDCIDQVVRWRGGDDLDDVSGQPIRLKFAMQDADLYSLRFRA